MKKIRFMISCVHHSYFVFELRCPLALCLLNYEFKTVTPSEPLSSSSVCNAN